jgi:GGDEF domain-containing protein
MLDDTQLGRVRALFPNVPDTDKALIAMIDAEAHRRGERDAISGAFHALALTQGSLLKEEYDLSTHGHHSGWVIGAAVIDIRELTVVNMNHGFETGDQVLHDTATALQRTCPTAKVVRVHSDAFAVLLGPMSDETITAELTRKLRSGLRQNARLSVEYSVGLLELTIAGPSHWQVLGPLVWAECERALVLARRAPYDGVLKRKIVLDGGLPEEAMSGR